MITEEIVDLVRTALANGENVLISGGTGTGKTTLLNALASLLPHSGSSPI
jgi:pilus assembly protein CpaF